MGSARPDHTGQFKVFPVPKGRQTLLAFLPTIAEVKAAFRALQHSPAEVARGGCVAYGDAAGRA